MKSSVHAGNDGQLWCTDLGASPVGTRDELLRRHTLREVVLVPGGPGRPSVTVLAAIFEKWDFCGHVFISLERLKMSILPGSSSMGPKWWQKKKGSLETSSSQYNLGTWAFRPSMPYGATGDASSAPQRCLMFSSISVGLLLVTCMRSCFTSSRQKGLVREDDVRVALAEAFNGMMKHMPLERCGLVQTT